MAPSARKRFKRLRVIISRRIKIVPNSAGFTALLQLFGIGGKAECVATYVDGNLLGYKQTLLCFIAKEVE